MGNVFVENNLLIEIHYFESNLHNLMVYITNKGKTYFVTPENYSDQLRQVKCPYIVEIEKAIVKFLNQDKS
jgi:hypothetical protein